ncbi:cyclic nucleotide-gated cation channel beta-1-like isoform X2 [Meriones unguiculatus]|uniref:cyclic nucleotide-gated cation channel beta-1-like isoform X2 n=1 Tax=Meriones unguiculatus TaxID=10047 RepID=UPI00293EAF30|nr:cyclic nucleotide-gated cation channel beta-1-like isoform X2 [Meriones unguiculatus]
MAPPIGGVTTPSKWPLPASGSQEGWLRPLKMASLSIRTTGGMAPPPQNGVSQHQDHRRDGSASSKWRLSASGPQKGWLRPLKMASLSIRTTGGMAPPPQNGGSQHQDHRRDGSAPSKWRLSASGPQEGWLRPRGRGLSIKMAARSLRTTCSGATCWRNCCEAKEEKKREGKKKGRGREEEGKRKGRGRKEGKRKEEGKRKGRGRKKMGKRREEEGKRKEEEGKRKERREEEGRGRRKEEEGKKKGRRRKRKKKGRGREEEGKKKEEEEERKRKGRRREEEGKRKGRRREEEGKRKEEEGKKKGRGREEEGKKKGRGDMKRINY